MTPNIYCRPTRKGVHSFYLVYEGEEYYLFSQQFRRGVHNYFSKGVTIRRAIDYSRANYDHALIHTMRKLPSYIKYIEKEYEIEVLEQSRKRGARRKAS